MKKIYLTFLTEDDEQQENDNYKNSQDGENPEICETKEEVSSDSPFDNITVGADGKINMDASTFMQLVKGIAEKGNSGKNVNADKNLIKTLVDELRTMSRQNDEDKEGRVYGLRPVDIGDIDPNDLLTPPAMFFSYAYSTAIYDDLKFGKPVKPPYGALKFRNIIRSPKNVGGKNPAYTNMSLCVVHSKKQAEFIRNHSHFGIRFFERMGDAQNVDATTADALVAAQNSLANSNDFQIMQRCLAEGIKVDTDNPQELKKRLIHKIADKLMSEQNKFATQQQNATKEYFAETEKLQEVRKTAAT